jgi:hypothetical protein
LEQPWFGIRDAFGERLHFVGVVISHQKNSRLMFHAGKRVFLDQLGQRLVTVNPCSSEVEYRALADYFSRGIYES